MQVTPRAPSKSAILTAAERALHREEPKPWVLDDSLAAALVGGDGPALVAQVRMTLTDQELSAFTHWVVARARFTEDLVEQQLAAGVAQYVILGAGLDSFAYRRADLTNRLRVFEVDHPASQEWKRVRLREIGVVAPDNLVYAPVDFESESLVDGLTRARFDWDSRATFSWIGVTMYLTLGAIDATLRALRSAARGSTIVMTYNQPPDTIDQLSANMTSKLAAAISAMGERFVSHFTPAQFHALVHEVGFSVVEDFGSHDARLVYFAHQPDALIGAAQRILVARVQ